MFHADSASPGRRAARRAAIAATVALLAVAAVEVVLGRGTLMRSLARLSHPRPGYVVLAAVCELASFLAYAAAQRRIAHAAGHRLTVGWLASLAVAAQALANFVPGGYVAANIFNVRQLRRRRLPTGAIAWVLLLTTLLYIGALAVLALLGAEIGGGRTQALRLAGGGVLAGLVLTVAAAVVLIRTSQARRVAELRARLGSVRPPARVLLGAAALFGVVWIADAACLVCALLALNIHPGWDGILAAYCGAQLVALLPVTPGGLGLVEGSLALALSTGRTSTAAALAAVLLYRMLSYWAILPAGAAGYGALRRVAAPVG
jgi:uncharacterized membrane protein YbhN (UPF0104 family)